MTRTVYAVSEGKRFAADTTLVTVECYSCGMVYAIPESLQRSALRWHGDRPNGWKLHCPLGHEWYYVGETAIERAKRLKNEATQRERATRDLLRHEERSHAATRGHLTRQKRRAHAGICPVQGCKRHFQDLERHMESKHPDYADTGTPEKT